MNRVCPVCNGLSAFHAVCQECSRPLDDSGRIYDYYGDYSPYREIDDSKLTNGMVDLQYHLCVHVGWCRSCRREQPVSVLEWDDSQLFTQSQQMPRHT